MKKLITQPKNSVIHFFSKSTFILIILATFAFTVAHAMAPEYSTPHAQVIVTQETTHSGMTMQELERTLNDLEQQSIELEATAHRYHATAYGSMVTLGIAGYLTPPVSTIESFAGISCISIAGISFIYALRQLGNETHQEAIDLRRRINEYRNYAVNQSILSERHSMRPSSYAATRTTPLSSLQASEIQVMAPPSYAEAVRLRITTPPPYCE